ncbi:SPASM domain-containing protein [archaeon]|jgi:uncharacterized protein|nr:SPASM domain-containing protein [archaeon]MBT7128613.1 SPASM domain-containing protein [archaeon]
MKKSKFNVFIPFCDEKEVIFNTFSDSRVIADCETIDAIKNCGQPHLLNDKQKGQLCQLKELGIVLDDNVDEDRAIEYWFQGVKFNSTIISANILTTLACNMKCVYCFEQGVKSNMSMSKEMASNVCKWLSIKMENLRPKELIIVFFGGEPLMNSEAVRFISETLYSKSKILGVTLHIEIITNGLLLTPDLVDYLRPLGLRLVKVTIDGDEACHDRMRPRKNGKGTYRDIVKNLLQIKGKIPIAIGGNYDDATKKHIPILLDDLKNMGFNDEIEKMSFKPILGFPGHKKQSVHSIKACAFSETNVDDIFWLIQEIEKRGFKPYKDIALGPCEAMRDHTYSIDPSGDIYNCVTLAGRKEYALGNIKDDPTEVRFNPLNVKIMTANLWRKCKDCKFVPICGGGCRVGAILQKGDTDALCCEKEYFEKVSTKLVISEIQ